MIKDLQKASDFVDLQNKIINNNITYRKEWEEECKSVMFSYSGNKFPVMTVNRKSGGSSLSKDKNNKGFVNLIKRQYRTTANYLLNNEPQYLITKSDTKATEADLVAKREFLNYIFNSAQKGQEDDMSFYDTVMDDVIFYGMFRGVVWTMAYYNKEKGIYEFRSYDSMDTYIDTDARSLRNIRKWITTYTKTKDWLKNNYQVDGFGSPIDWDAVNKDKKETESDTKRVMLKDKPDSEVIIVREGYYLENEGGKDKLYKIITTQNQFLAKEEIGIDYLPVTYFSPMNEPEKLYPRSWYADMVELEREINELIGKINRIVKTGGRFVYIREGTTLTKGTSNMLNSLDIEVIEVAETQELPQQAQLLSVSQADIQHLDFLMRQAEEEGGMKSDIMGTSSLGADASGRAIQALQAGSKNNIGPVLNELNKYMNRLVRIILRLHDTYGSELDIVNDSGSTKIDKQRLKYTQVKVSITGRDAFDEVTKQIQGIQILDYITKFDPNVKISPETITKIFGVTNDIATDIQKDIDKETNPDLQISEGENKKLMQAIPINANPTDDHQLHMAMHSELLKNFPPESDAGQAMLNHIRMHESFLSVTNNK